MAKTGEIVVSTNELTGVRSLERKHPALPLAPGHVERREFEYTRHGTAAFIVNFEVATGKVPTVSTGPTRKEQDFAQHIQRTVESSPAVAKWHFVVDNLNIHQSEALVRYVADESDLSIDLGVKGTAASCNRRPRGRPSWQTQPIGSSFITRPNTALG